MPQTTSDALRWAIRWGGILAVIGVFDLWRNSKHDGSTLSASVRWVLATDTPEGKRIFEGMLMAFHQHILK